MVSARKVTLQTLVSKGLRGGRFPQHYAAASLKHSV